MGFRIDYTVREHGWAFVRFADGDWSCESDVGYLTDPLTALAMTALSFFDADTAERYVPERIVFDAERSAVTLDLRNVPVDALEASDSVETIGSLGCDAVFEAVWRDEDDRFPHTTPITLGEFALETLRVLETVYDAHGIVGYRERWQEAEFPVAAMVRLREALGLPPAERRLW